tara:strand:- start:10832 stop:11770 length:939 start_codon:yes stop_codon:yes gene_type:complete
VNLQPTKLDNFIGQDRIKKAVSVSIQASKKRKQAFPHILIYGGSGLGKTTLANIIANECKSYCSTFLASVLESHEPVYTALKSMQRNDFLFIDEVHALPKKLQETLYTAMTDKKIETTINGYRYTHNINDFTCMSATTEIGSLTPPFRERFGFIIGLDKYTDSEMQTIVSMYTDKLKFKHTKEAIKIIAGASRLNPRTATRIIDRCADTAVVSKSKSINESIVLETLDYLQIDTSGLTYYDFVILRMLQERFRMMPTGLSNLALTANIDEKDLTNMYEPFLVEHNLIERTPRGRVITQEGIIAYANYRKKNK